MAAIVVPIAVLTFMVCLPGGDVAHLLRNTVPPRCGPTAGGGAGWCGGKCGVVPCAVGGESTRPARPPPQWQCAYATIALTLVGGCPDARCAAPCLPGS